MSFTEQLGRLEAAADKLTAQGSTLIEEGKNLQTAARELRGQIARLTHMVINTDAEIEISRNGHAPAPEPSVPEPAAPAPAQVPEVDSRSVGRFGEVNREVAKKVCQQLGEFNKTAFREKSGLDGSASTRWLTLLVEERFLRFGRGRYRVLVPASVRDWMIWHKEETFSVEEVARMCQLTVEKAQKELEDLHKRQVLLFEDGRYQYDPPKSWQGPREHVTLPPPERTTRPAYELAPPDRGMPVRVAAVKKATRRQRSTAGAGGVKGPKQRDARYNRAQEAKRQREAKQREKQQGNGRKAA